MKFLYLTTKSYPATTADHLYIRELSRAFTSLLKTEFTLLVNKNTGADLAAIPHAVIGGGVRWRLLRLAFLLCSSRGAHLRSSDVFFSNDFNITLLLIVLKKLRVIHGSIAFDAHLMTRTWKDAFLFNAVDHIFSTSDVLAGHITTVLHKKNTQINTVRGGVDLGVYSEIRDTQSTVLRSEYSLLDSKKTVIGYIGGFKSMGHDKGLAVLIQSLALLPEEYVCLFVGGHAKEIDEYKKYAQALMVADRCLFIEKIDFSEVPLFQMMCDILVIPYPDEPHFSDFGFPMKVFEYLAAGRPIVYSNLKIMAEVLEGVGVPFIPGDHYSFLEAVLSLQNVKKHAVVVDMQKYTWHHKAATILTILKQN